MLIEVEYLKKEYKICNISLYFQVKYQLHVKHGPIFFKRHKNKLLNQMTFYKGFVY